MTYDPDRSDRFLSSDIVDHWLDEALRAVPLPDDFLTRMSTLADAAPGAGETRDFLGPLEPTRGVLGARCGIGKSSRRTRPQ